ncbi:putative calcium-binding protein CML19 [Dioscorea cayenensis subsp. rotundata]|uniref:Calcium-binding protein CML19 n=1 Tax=Dioscorea cayennensis subsp. rotundata TaxID=55577 RepID=A0AB40BRV7_DIOCR|nr:putative calcium-binding protein CML19 [Dioscorea cayenensis subsp. rotundata]
MLNSLNRPSFIQKLCCILSPKKLDKKPILMKHAASTAPVSTTTCSSKSGEFERVFHYFDEDKDGKISPTELRNCMRTVGEELSAEDAEALVVSTDSDGDGLLGFEDFVKLVDVEGEEEKRRNLRDAFKVYEMEGRDCITPKSLRRALSKLGESKTVEECTKMINRFDINGDGVLSFEEFSLMML